MIFKGLLEVWTWDFPCGSEEDAVNCGPTKIQTQPFAKKSPEH
jgi:hypothetical protein